MNRLDKRRATLVTLALLIGVVGGATLSAGFRATKAAGALVPPSVESEGAWTGSGSAPPSMLAMSQGFADLAEAATSGVARIEVTTTAPSTAVDGFDFRGMPDPFQRFFDPAPGDPTPQPRFGGGSGFVVSEEGYIVTNNHVVADADEIRVVLSDHRSFVAKLVGSDPTTDVAVIKIEADELHPLKWGSSAALRVGEWVMAIGNPGIGGAGQLDYTVTTGIVSAKGRPLQLLGQGLAEDPRYGSALAGYAIENFIQTDAVINPGNSGGPMVDMNGRVVGVNSAIASTDGYYQGYGFAVPANLARKVSDDLIEFGEVRRAWLGVQVTAISAEDAEAEGLPSVSGVLVQGVTEGSPADDAGLQQGDVIAAVEGVTVRSGGELQEVVAVRSQGDRVELRVFRGGKVRLADVRLGAAPELQRASMKAPKSGAADVRGSTSVEALGITLTLLDAQLAERLGFPSPRGVVVERVDPLGPAARRGVAVGLKLIRVNDVEIQTVEDAAEALHDVAENTIVTLLLETASGQSRVVNVRAR